MATGLGILLAMVLVPCSISNLWPAAYPESLTYPNNNGVVPLTAGRVNGQESFNWDHNHSWSMSSMSRYIL